MRLSGNFLKKGYFVRRLDSHVRAGRYFIIDQGQMFYQHRLGLTVKGGRCLMKYG